MMEWRPVTIHDGSLRSYGVHVASPKANIWGLECARGNSIDPNSKNQIHNIGALIIGMGLRVYYTIVML